MPESPNPEARQRYIEAERAKYQSWGHLSHELHQETASTHSAFREAQRLYEGQRVRQRVGHWLYVFQDVLPRYLEIHGDNRGRHFVNLDTLNCTLFDGLPNSSSVRILYDDAWCDNRNGITHAIDTVLLHKGLIRSGGK